MALSERGMNRSEELAPDGRTVLPPEKLDRVKRAKERGFLTLLPGGLLQARKAVGETVTNPTYTYPNPAHHIVDPEDGLTLDEWVRNPELLADVTPYWEIKDPKTGEILEQYSEEKVYF